MATSGTKKFPFPEHVSRDYHINPATQEYLQAWMEAQGENSNLEYLYGDLYALLNELTFLKNFILFTGPKMGIHKRIMRVLLHPMNLSPMEMVRDDHYLRWILSKDAVIVNDLRIDNYNYNFWYDLLCRHQKVVSLEEDPYNHHSAQHEAHPLFVDAKPFIIFAEEGAFLDPTLSEERRISIENLCLREYKINADADRNEHALRPIDVFHFFKQLQPEQHNAEKVGGAVACNTIHPADWDKTLVGCAYDEYKKHDTDANGYCYTFAKYKAQPNV